MTALLETMVALWLWTLAASTHASLAIVLVLLIQWVTADRLPAAWRYRLWLVVVLRLAWPFFPQSPFSVFHLADAVLPSKSHSAQVSLDGRWNQGTAHHERAQAVLAGREKTVDPPHAPSSSHARSPEIVPSESRFSVAIRWCAGVWAGGVALLAIRSVAAWRSLAAQVRRMPTVTDAATISILDECRQRLGVLAPVLLVSTPGKVSPALTGVVRPRLILPNWLVGAFTPTELRHVLLHELAHHKRHDVAVQWLTLALQIVHWFNPFVSGLPFAP